VNIIERVRNWIAARFSHRDIGVAISLVAAPLLMVAIPACAVSVSPDGMGQVLLFPYYSASASGNSFATLVSVVNTTPNIKAVRVRIREASEGAPVADVNVYLDGNDVWTVAILPTADGAGMGTFDRSCTLPVLSSNVDHLTPFNNLSYRDGLGDVSLDRTREGTIEVIEMGDYGPSAGATGVVALGVQHLAGLPHDCSVVADDTGAEAQAPAGGLIGSAMLLSVSGSVDFFYPAVALTGFTDRKSGFGAIGPDTPSLADASPPVSIVRDATGRTIRSEWARGIDAVSGALMSASIQGEFVLEPNTDSQTNWLVAFPTKWHYVHNGLSPTAPFRNAYGADGACELVYNPTIGGNIHRRDGATPLDLFDIPPSRSPFALCYTAQVASFNATTIFPSINPLRSTGSTTGVPSSPSTIATPYATGWATLPLDTDANDAGVWGDAMEHRLVSGPSTIFNADGSVEQRPQMTYFGLPAAGFAVSSYYNGTLVDSYGRNLLSAYVAGTALRNSVHVE